jgi:hypothetical protein
MVDLDQKYNEPFKLANNFLSVLLKKRIWINKSYYFNVPMFSQQALLKVDDIDEY